MKTTNENNQNYKVGDKVKLNDGFDKEGKPVIREYTISKPSSIRRNEDRLNDEEFYLTSPGTIGFDVSKKWLSENAITK